MSEITLLPVSLWHTATKHGHSAGGGGSAHPGSQVTHGRIEQREDVVLQHQLHLFSVHPFLWRETHLLWGPHKTSVIYASVARGSSAAGDRGLGDVKRTFNRSSASAPIQCKEPSFLRGSAEGSTSIWWQNSIIWGRTCQQESTEVRSRAVLLKLWVVTHFCIKENKTLQLFYFRSMTLTIF